VALGLTVATVETAVLEEVIAMRIAVALIAMGVTARAASAMTVAIAIATAKQRFVVPVVCDFVVWLYFRDE